MNLKKDHPELGPVRRFPSNVPTDIRFFPIPDFPNYLMFYRATSGVVEILRVLQSLHRFPGRRFSCCENLRSD